MFNFLIEFFEVNYGIKLTKNIDFHQFCIKKLKNRTCPSTKYDFVFNGAGDGNRTHVVSLEG